MAIASSTVAFSPSSMFMCTFRQIFIQSFTMTTLAEWGDRSQLATIILAAREDVYGVCVGGVLGHALCTGLAVLGGRIIATRISVRTVTLVSCLVLVDDWSGFWVGLCLGPSVSVKFAYKNSMFSDWRCGVHTVRPERAGRQSRVSDRKPGADPGLALVLASL